MRIGRGEPALVPLAEIDLSDAAVFRDRDQHGAWRTLREQAPVWRHRAPSGADVWSVTRYDSCQRVLNDHKSFTAERGSILDVVGIGDRAGGVSMALTDPPRHTPLRIRAMPVVSTQSVRALETEIRARIQREIAPWLAGGEHDAVVVARELPMAASGQLIGLEPSDWSSVAYWSMAAIAPDDPAYAVGSRQATLMQAHHELFGAMSSAIRARRKQPQHDLISAFLAVAVEGRRLTDGEIALTLYNIVMGANNTTPQAVCQLLVVLAEQPSIFGQLAADPSLVPTVVEEILRWASPANHFVRHAVRDVELEGTLVPAGAALCAWIASANRDERAFPNPYEFDVRRTPNPHLAFGVGAHYCIGAPAARLLLSQVIEELVANVERIELSGEPVHLAASFVNGLASLPLKFVPRGSARSGASTTVERASLG